MEKISYGKYKRVYRLISSVLLLLGSVVVFAGVWLGYINERITQPFALRGNYLMIFLYLILFWVFFSLYGGLKVGYERLSHLLYSQIIADICVNAVTSLIVMLLSNRIANMYYMLLTAGVQLVFMGVTSCVLNLGYVKLFPPRQLLMIYGDYDKSAALLEAKMNERKEKYHIAEKVSYHIGFDAVCPLILHSEGVVLVDVPAQLRNRILKYCYARAIRVYTAPNISDLILKYSESIHFFDTPLLLSRNSGLSIEEKIGKRLMDLFISSLGILITSPFMLVIGAAIKLYDHGPVFFKQERVTNGGRCFMILKFRSMIVDAEKEGLSVPATERDPRITPVGRVIRATRLDELPQLFNIFKGDMSVVGPRPERVEHVEKYTKEIPEFGFRLKVKGGLTGYAQIYGKYNTSAYDKLKLDLMYIEDYSLFLDIKLILMTIKIMFMPESTEGFSEEESKEMTQAGKKDD